MRILLIAFAILAAWTFACSNGCESDSILEVDAGVDAAPDAGFDAEDDAEMLDAETMEDAAIDAEEDAELADSSVEDASAE